MKKSIFAMTIAAGLLAASFANAQTGVKATKTKPATTQTDKSKKPVPTSSTQAKKTTTTKK
jgi:hypothetical protein